MTKQEKLVNKIAESLDENKGHQIVKIDLRNIENCFYNFFVICHGTSNTHVSALADAVEDKILEDLHEKPFHIEGRDQAQWIVVDYGDVIVHVFQKEQREYYQLEDFWGDGIKEELSKE